LPSFKESTRVFTGTSSTVVDPEDASQIDDEMYGPSVEAGLVNVPLDEIELQLQRTDDQERQGSDAHAFLDSLNAKDPNLRLASASMLVWALSQGLPFLLF
jgi:hypothetical protein